jgi:cell division protein FtsN
MCGDIMITKNKTKQSSSPILVVTIMCAVVMTIVGQSLTNYRTTYAENNPIPNSQLLTQTHGIAPTSPDMKYRIVEQLQTLVDEQKKAFDNYVL